jgi:hypothetical protein
MARVFFPGDLLMGDFSMNLKYLAVAAVCALVVAAIIYGVIETILAADLTRL